MKRTIVQHIASAVQARLNCIESGNTEWRDRHEATIESLVKQHMPHGSGFDNRTFIDLSKSTGEKLVFSTAFHHMNDAGYYDGWTEHTITVRPAFVGVNLTISGKNRNDIKEYIAETFDLQLGQEIDADRA